MDLQEFQSNWDALGDEDSFWATCSDPSPKGGRWDTAEFLAVGVGDVERTMEQALRLRPDIGRDRAPR